MCCAADTPDPSDSNESDDDENNDYSDDGGDDDDDGDDDDEGDGEEEEDAESSAPNKNRSTDSDLASKRRRAHDRSEVDDQHFSLASMEAFTQQVRRRCTRASGSYE